MFCIDREYYPKGECGGGGEACVRHREDAK